MFENLKKWMEENTELGISFWFAYDPITKKPSITLFMAYIAFWVAVISLICLHFDVKLILATGMSILFASIMIVFYLIRSINKAKFDLTDKSFSVEGDEKDKKDDTK